MKTEEVNELVYNILNAQDKKELLEIVLMLETEYEKESDSNLAHIQMAVSVKSNEFAILGILSMLEDIAEASGAKIERPDTSRLH